MTKPNGGRNVVMLSKEQTSFGGSMTIAMLVSIIGIATHTIDSYATTTRVATRGFLPEARSTVSNVTGSIEVGMVVHSYYSMPCPDPTINAPGRWNISHTNLPSDFVSQGTNYTNCAYIARCESCSITQPTSVSLVVPWWFMWGSWATSAKGASLTKGNESYDVLSGTWNKPISGLVDQVTAQLSLTSDVQTLGVDVAGGFVTTLADVSTSEVSFGSTTTLTIELVPSGLVFLTEFEESTTAATEAWSIIVGGAAGMVQLFRILVPFMEWLALQWKGKKRQKQLSVSGLPDSRQRLLEGIEEEPLERSTSSFELPQHP